jgi:hypothetical protein
MDWVTIPKPSGEGMSSYKNLKWDIYKYQYLIEGNQ